ncbi:hypothetical protein OUZ56_001254 [Daphnia magna]|uniref:Uncharacterized protein n=1 Tax=Daphnia magna TaxID=35525 RepID=A0ABR0A248_9CRUS|nr:hypothetical protein OUZ56_001254 [Daphnia magna]
MRMEKQTFFKFGFPKKKQKNLKGPPSVSGLRDAWLITPTPVYSSLYFMFLVVVMFVYYIPRKATCLFK